MGKKRGIVWNYFYKKVHGSQIVAFCKYCDQSYIQNATRMEKHIERCSKCPESDKRHFLNALRNKRVKTMIGIKFAEENCSAQEPLILHGGKLNIMSIDSEDNHFSEASNKEKINTNENFYTESDSKSWQEQSTEFNINTQDPRYCDNAESNSQSLGQNSNHIIDPAKAVQSQNETTYNTHKMSPDITLTSGQIPSYSVVQKIEEEQLLEKRALRQAAEIELQKKSIELERMQWEYETEKLERDYRWAHECRLMQIEEQKQEQILQSCLNKKN